MNCPLCKAWASVLETRTRPDGVKRRRYRCANEHRFSTLEVAETLVRGTLVKPGAADANRKAA